MATCIPYVGARDPYVSRDSLCSGLTNCSGPLILDTFQATFSNSAIIAINKASVPDETPIQYFTPT